MSKKGKSVKEVRGYRIYSQYILIGAAIGLYYGIFYRGTQTTPDYAMAVYLAVLAGVLTTAVRSWKKKKTFKMILFDFLKVTATFLVFLMALQLKPLLEKVGGRTLVIVGMTLVGTGFGLIFGMRRKTAEQPAQKGKSQ